VQCSNISNSEMRTVSAKIKCVVEIVQALLSLSVVVIRHSFVIFSWQTVFESISPRRVSTCMMSADHTHAHKVPFAVTYLSGRAAGRPAETLYLSTSATLSTTDAANHRQPVKVNIIIRRHRSDVHSFCSRHDYTVRSASIALHCHAINTSN